MTALRYSSPKIPSLTRLQKLAILEHIKEDPTAFDFYRDGLQITIEELEEWKRKYATYGKNGLLATRRNKC